MKTTTILLTLLLVSSANAAKLRGIKGSRGSERDLQIAMQKASMQSIASGSLAKSTTNMQSVSGGTPGGASKAFTIDTTGEIAFQMMASPGVGIATAVPAAPPASFGGGELIIVDGVSSQSVDNMNAVYKITFTNMWSGTNHPNDYPSKAHWSPPVVVSHNGGYEMWRAGVKSTAGVQDVAETGDITVLFSEFEVAGDKIGVSDLGTTQMNSQQQSQEDLVAVVTSAHQYVSSITMIVPSPDWFSGFYNLQPVTNGMWWKEFIVDTYPWDAGTDSGVTYTSADKITDPQHTIFQITSETAPAESQVFVKDGDIHPVARWTFILQE